MPGKRDAPQKIRLRTGSWHTDALRSFPVPREWKVEILKPTGAAALSTARMRKALRAETGMPPIARAARGSDTAVVLVDDLARPTPAADLCPLVMDELNRAGIPDERISIVLAGGGHMPHTQREKRLKLGAALSRAGRVVQHDVNRSATVFLGLTGSGCPVLVNRVAAEASFSVGISSVYPHGAVGFGGGGKIVLPGISHISSIHWLHGRETTASRGSTRERSGIGRCIAEATAMFGLDVSVSCILNGDRRISALHAGSPPATHRRAVASARRIYRTPYDPGARYDLVVANAYPMDSEATQASKSTWPRAFFKAPLVVVFDPIRLKHYHALFHPEPGRAGAHRNGFQRCDPDGALTANQILFCPAYGKRFQPRLKGWHFENNWPRLIERLRKRFASPRVLVLPAGPYQLLERVRKGK